jgi:hypothetical protein
VNYQQPGLATPPRGGGRLVTVIVGVGCLALGVIIGVSVHTVQTTSPAAVPIPTATATGPSPARLSPAATKPARLVDQDWQLVSLGAVGDDGAGDASAPHAQILNAAAHTRSANFTVTLSRAGTVVATLTGSAQKVGAGRMVTVPFLAMNQDKPPKLPVTVAFQVDVSYDDA